MGECLDLTSIIAAIDQRAQALQENAVEATEIRARLFTQNVCIDLGARRRRFIANTGSLRRLNRIREELAQLPSTQFEPCASENSESCTFTNVETQLGAIQGRLNSLRRLAVRALSERGCEASARNSAARRLTRRSRRNLNRGTIAVESYPVDVLVCE